MIGRSAIILAATGSLAVAAAALWPLPPAASLASPPGLVVLDRHGTPLLEDTAAGYRVPVRLAAVAPAAVAATVAVEDQRFFAHPGIDPLAMARALATWPQQPSGASTITQQLVRRSHLRDPGLPAFLRKPLELALALRTERDHDKHTILELYLNEVYYGRGAYGIEAAARSYFGVTAAQLSLAQAATLAGLPQRPSIFGPGADPAPVIERREYVLGRMVATGALSEPDAARARAEPLKAAPAPAAPAAPHFTALVRAEVARLLPQYPLGRGLVVRTTLDATLQSSAAAAVETGLARVAGRDVGSAAVVAMEPASGHVLAMVGGAGWDSDRAGQLNLALRERDPGSALKPFLFAAAMDHGLTLASSLHDVPAAFATREGPYAPLDYDRRFRGPVPARVALASSLNVPAIRLLDAVGLDAFLAVLHRGGLDTLDRGDSYGLALALGAGGVRLLDLTAAYGALASGGRLARPSMVLDVRDHSGRLLYEAAPPEPQAVLAPEVAYLLADALSDPAARRPGFGDLTPLDLPFRAAVKTGTSAENRDNWTVGFTRDLVVGVWAGNPEGEPMAGVSGVQGAAPIWRAVMLAAARTAEPAWLPAPAGLVTAAVCWPSGLRPSADCPITVREAFVPGTVPTATDTLYHRRTDGSLALRAATETLTWAVAAGVPTVPGGRGGSAITIETPLQGAVYHLAPELAEQGLLLRAAAPLDSLRVDLLMDGQVVASGAPLGPPPTWRPTAGRHRFEVVAHLPDGVRLRSGAEFDVVAGRR